MMSIVLVLVIHSTLGLLFFWHWATKNESKIFCSCCRGCWLTWSWNSNFRSSLLLTTFAGNNENVSRLKTCCCLLGHLHTSLAAHKNDLYSKVYSKAQTTSLNSDYKILFEVYLVRIYGSPMEGDFIFPHQFQMSKENRSTRQGKYLG